jgi:hypothetical protein
VAVSFIGGGNRSTWITTDLPQVTDKLYHIIVLLVDYAEKTTDLPKVMGKIT